MRGPVELFVFLELLVDLLVPFLAGLGIVVLGFRVTSPTTHDGQGGG